MLGTDLSCLSDQCFFYAVKPVLQCHKSCEYELVALQFKQKQAKTMFMLQWHRK